MLDLTKPKHKIIDAALKLAETYGWRGLSLDLIANSAGVTLNDLRTEFSTKAQMLAAFGRAVDDAVLAKVTAADADIAARDRLFDVLMTRFEIMAPYKSGLSRIKKDLRFQPGESMAQLCVAARSLYWMMAAAGIDAEGKRGAVRLSGLMALYVRVFDIWLDDDDPGLARTMAALDSRLRRGERVFQRLDDLNETAMRFCARIWTAMDGRRTPEPSTYETTKPDTAPGSSSANGSGSSGPAPAV